MFSQVARKLKIFCISIVLLLLGATPVFARTGTPTNLASGTYIFVPVSTQKKALSIIGASKKAGAGTQIYTNKEKTYQIFTITNLGNGKYRIQNKKSGLYLAVKGNKQNVYNGFQQTAYKNTSRQRWYIGKTSNGYVIESSYGLKALSLQKNRTKNKTVVYGKKFEYARGQYWKLVKYNKKTAPTQIKATAVVPRNWDDAKDYPILTNIIGAVESGGQVYGQRDYACYEEPYANSLIEHTITVGWAQFYGDEAQTLIQNICNANPAEYKTIDPTGLIKKVLKKDWVTSRYKPTAREKQIIIKLITTTTGKKLQDKQFQEQISYMVTACKNKYTSQASAIHMYCQIRHLGGLGAVNKIFDKCNGNYSLINIMKTLAEDQLDSSSDNQVGDLKYWKRHEKCVEFINRYVL